jgi:SAM-dependent methyltransferase
MDPSNAPEERPRSVISDALVEHRRRVAEVLPSGDPAAIKQLYIELGELIDDAVQGDSSQIHALSLPETLPVIAALASDLSGIVLDAGCGPNPVFSIMISSPRRTMIGLDISQQIVRLAVERSEQAGVRLLGVVGDLEALPFRDSVIDGCVCEDTIEHLPDDRKGTEELARVLKTGGRLILGTPNRVRLDVLVDKFRNRLKGKRLPASHYYAASSHLREYTWGGLERLVRPWFRIRRRATVGWSESPRRRAVSTVVGVWPFRQVGRMVILDAEQSTSPGR